MFIRKLSVLLVLLAFIVTVASPVVHAIEHTGFNTKIYQDEGDMGDEDQDQEAEPDYEEPID
jgi:hypothetical protein